MVLDSDGDVFFSNMCGRHDVRLCVEQLLSSGQICIVAMIPVYATQALPGFDRPASDKPAFAFVPMRPA